MIRQAWYIFDGGRTQGPVSVHELLYQVEMDSLGPDALVWRPGFSDWTLAHEVEGLFTPPVPPCEPQLKSAPPRPAANPTSVPQACERDVPRAPQPIDPYSDDAPEYRRAPSRPARRSRLRTKSSRDTATMAAVAVPASFEFRAHEHARHAEDTAGLQGQQSRPRRDSLLGRIEAISHPA